MQGAEGRCGCGGELWGGGGCCYSEWTALHWQDKIKIDSLITASQQKQPRRREI